MADETRVRQRRAVAEDILARVCADGGEERFISPGYEAHEALVESIEAALLAAEVEQRRRDAAIARSGEDNDWDCEQIAAAIEVDGESDTEGTR